MGIKTCIRCKTEQYVKNFYKNSSSKDGHLCYCKACVKVAGKLYYLANLTARRIYRQSHKIQRKLYIQQNYAKLKAQKNTYNRNKRKADPNFKLAYYIRARINKAINRNSRAGSSVRDLGCTVPKLKAYIENLWQPGMSWENWGNKGWHIDHIIPLSSFDLTDREQFLKACHYTNLQPLWAIDNIRKGSK